MPIANGFVTEVVPILRVGGEFAFPAFHRIGDVTGWDLGFRPDAQRAFIALRPQLAEKRPKAPALAGFHGHLFGDLFALRWRFHFEHVASSSLNGKG
jgi:hypothetical protein